MKLILNELEYRGPLNDEKISLFPGRVSVSIYTTELDRYVSSNEPTTEELTLFVDDEKNEVIEMYVSVKEEN